MIEYLLARINGIAEKKFNLRYSYMNGVLIKEAAIAGKAGARLSPSFLTFTSEYNAIRYLTFLLEFVKTFRG